MQSLRTPRTKVLQIVHAYNHRITVVECDNEVRRTYTMESVKM